MVLALDSDVLAALETSGTSVYRASAYYGSEQTLAEVPLFGQGSISFDGSAAVESSGTLYLGDSGTDYTPRNQQDTFAPFGQEIALWRSLQNVGSAPGIPLGRFRITEVPDMEEYFHRYPSQRDAGWSLQLTVRDRMDILQNDDFTAPTSTVAGPSTWTEIQRLMPQGLGLRTSLVDTAVPAGITYTSMSDAITKLMANLNGVPHMTRDGLLTARARDRWLTATTPEFEVNGTVAISDTMTNKLYNCVVVTNPNDPKILGIKMIDEPAHPLYVRGPFGRRPYKLADPLMTTQAMADAAAATSLARVSTQQAHTVTFSCLPRPDLEIGDFGDVIDEVSDKTYRGEIATMQFSLDPTDLMSGTMTVAEVITP
ncbi:hypothetical protein IT072_03620 [Leifsonia sp. ZF2019]|uniref:hypothetical protein n=1 Tax=Leifsonia sp. ZF2019 TaxID=2781978 RepID=UPI001CBEC767|nr:hypothetical protein [Leifsonia sp. ZF2019]UAJ80147.1 hypothetical protein IT072_03620 [Leifsonia sp. ZF2019]